MVRRSWVVALPAFAACVALLQGCPHDDGPQPFHDSGVCTPYDFGVDEVTEDADAADGGETTDAGDAADVTTDVDATVVDAADAPDVDTIDGAPDGATDAATSDAPADAAPETMANFGPKVCRSQVDDIISVSCSFNTCHGRAPDGQSGLYLPKPEDGDWYPNVVGAKSRERPDLDRVKPGDPRHSWLAHKIAGDQCLFGAQCVDGDCGDQMPATNQPLDQTDLDTILRWIAQGADRGCDGGVP